MLLLVHGLLLSGAGCGDECAEGEVRCRDNGAEYCGRRASDSHEPFVWKRIECGAGSCQLSTDAQRPEPFCTLKKEPDVRCSGTTDACDGNDLLHCRQGFLVSSTDCVTRIITSADAPASTSGLPPGVCVSVDQWAACALAPEPDPRCQPSTGWTRVCGDNEQLTCDHGYVLGVVACPGTGSCVPDPEGGDYAFCATTKAPDPRCPSAGYENTFCADGVVRYCRLGWPTYEQPCDQGTCAQVAAGQNGYCTSN